MDSNEQNTSVDGNLLEQIAPVKPEKIAETDRLTLELAKLNRKVALAQAEKALAQNENADLSYKYVVLQLYMKYGMTAADALNESGDIIRGGGTPQVKL